MSGTVSTPPTETDHDAEWRREAYTMAFYVAICLIAALVALDDGQHGVPTLAIVWGTTIGLALAHFFAFRLASRLVGSGRMGPRERSLGLAQLGGAAAVAILVSVPVLFVDASVELDVARLVLGGLIGLAAYAVGRFSGATRFRSTLFCGVVLVLGLGVASLKNYLAGH
jgi:hypothetical protein